jgi:hypothetical protein
MIKLIDLVREAKQVGTLVHSTSYESALAIMKSNFILKSGAMSGDSEENRYISFTRNLEGWHGASGVNFIIDGDKLSQKYKITPYEFDPDDIMYEGNSSEQEERIDASKYNGQVSIYNSLESIVILKPGDKYEWMKEGYDELVEYIKSHNIDKHFKVIALDKKENLNVVKRRKGI